MDSKLSRLLLNIESRLSDNDIVAFKIGKSENSHNRFLQYDEPYHYLGVVARGNATKINQAEIDLINWAQQRHLLANKCINTNDGGGGSSNATELYIVARRANANCGSHLLPPDELFNFQPITL